MDELIVKCLLGEASQEEEARLEKWLEASEENRVYYESFQHAWQVTAAHDTVDANAEWGQFKRSVRPRYWRALAVAASVLLVLMIAAWPGKQSTKRLVIGKTVTRHRLSTPRQHLLPDGSTVWVGAGSNISWQEPFHRQLSMQGTARFDIRKDSIHPFTIQCNRFSITVLGTVFTVDERRVRLYEGKVMVTVLQKNYYLLPGEEFVLDTVTNKITIRPFVATPKANGIQPIDDIPLPYNDHGNWYMFNNQSLSQVFDQLQQIYDVEIVYQEADLQKMYFIGRFVKSDSIDNILRQIAALNHLTVVKENERYIISK